eukprot:CAMPEP_0204216368 /NCGR_PEP_ID=MMETSP0361-20130328/78127_1 /ASSEMBLY_ACC=CAM_ASM_000343 /TAXON_ID=268821 /ORGANISM="Scrippsiella Hangoei, Strain SHTV-5" /LENGTH=30 /DNA_ID= /DNA_START= /DNA_END= /DNA_ORIENTATION=
MTADFDGKFRHRTVLIKTENGYVPSSIKSS